MEALFDCVDELIKKNKQKCLLILGYVERNPETTESLLSTIKVASFVPNNH
jgi:hypothetical protein